MSVESDQVHALLRLVDILDRLGIPYAIGGSVASAYYGEPRSTHDVDLLVELDEPQVAPLTAALAPDFHVDEPSARGAVSRRDSFQVLQLRPILKFDVFVAGGAPLDRAQMALRVLHELDRASQRRVFVTSGEVIVLRKLDWFRKGGLVSDRQWRDVLGVLKVQSGRLDLDRMRALARETGLDHLLRRALEEAGVEPAE